MKSWFQDGISIDETRFSTFILILIPTFVYTIYYHYTHGVIGEELLSLIRMLVLAIFGINVASISTNLFNRKEKDRDYNER